MPRNAERAGALRPILTRMRACLRSAAKGSEPKDRMLMHGSPRRVDLGDWGENNTSTAEQSRCGGGHYHSPFCVPPIKHRAERSTSGRLAGRSQSELPIGFELLQKFLPSLQLIRREGQVLHELSTFPYLSNQIGEIESLNPTPFH
jgi:hypothetical protein